MRIPRSIMIKGKRWTVSRRKVVKTDDGIEVHGLCCTEERVIQLERGLPRDIEALTFVHEVFHAILHENHVQLDYDLEEVIVDGLSSVLMELFKVRLK